MKNYNFKLDEQEQQIVDVVTRNHKYRHLKDPKQIYMNAVMEALKLLSK
jgi:hypothetical protein